MSDLPPDGSTESRETERPPTNAALLHAFLIGRDVPCPRCGYNLRDATGDVCSECGTVVRLSISPTEPVMRAWIAAVVAASIGAGIGLLFIALAFGRAGLPPSEYWWVVALSWVALPIAPLLAFRRRPFLRMANGAQWGVAAVLLGVDAAILFGLMTIR